VQGCRGSRRLPPADLGRPPMGEVELVDDRAISASPGHSAANSVSAATDATKAPEKKPSLSQHRFWHHYGDGCALVAGSQ
jgi:hypothetical protein